MRIFENHKATLLINNDRYCIIDWRNENGTVVHYINYVLDKQRGVFMISGDMGECIAHWGNKLSVHNLCKYIYNDVGYFISKFCCSSLRYTFDDKDILKDIKQFIQFIDTDCDDVLWSDVMDEIEDSRRDDYYFHPNENLREILRDLDPDFWKWISTCGRKIHPNVKIWALGFKLAVEQLGDEIKEDD